MKIRLERTSTGDEGTFGVLILPRWWCFSLELPWRGNANSISCIPTGTYPCALGRMSRTVGGRRILYRVDEVPGRDGVFIHAGNWAGDRAKGFRTDSLGCPLLGRNKAVLRGQRAIAGSTLTITRFLEETAGMPFELEIVEEK